MDQGLYQKLRPTKLKDVRGQDEAVAVVRGLLAGATFPKAVLLFGPPGTGKTTIARILCGMLGCGRGDYYEMNSANFRGIDSARDVDQQMRMRAMKGGPSGKRVWIFDEAHKWSSDAQVAMLKPLEDAPGHVHFFLCTTDPQKLHKAVRSRCTPVGLKAVNTKVLAELVLDAAKSEGVELDKDVADAVAENADGSPRNALTILEGVMNVPPEQMLGAVRGCNDKALAIDLCRVLINPKAAWPDVAKVLRDVDEDPESLRRMVLGYCQGILLSEKPSLAVMPRAYLVMSIFRYDFYNSGKPGLVAACWEVLHSGKKG